MNRTELLQVTTEVFVEAVPIRNPTKGLSTMSNSSTAVSRQTAIFDLVLIVGCLLIAKTALLQIESIWSYAGPIALMLTLLVATWRLRSSRQSWSDIGVKRPKSWLRLGLQTLIALIVTIGVGILAQSLANSFIGVANEATPVSYTHLTLPTKRTV